MWLPWEPVQGGSCLASRSLGYLAGDAGEVK